MKLPIEFLNRMKQLLGGNEYSEFLDSYDKPRHYGLRVNTLKISVDEFLKISPFKLESIPWTSDGFYYREGESPGRHPYYHAGLYYIQEPSAMLPGAIIDAKPGERVLDLCAAPGGKTVQIAAGMRGKGLLVANDINSDRVKALVKNIELCGVTNAIVTNESPDKLANNFEGFFDKILVDAPCSGEGMFRKDEEAARSWEKFKSEKCAGMQRDILANVDRMLKPGGVIAYSTCTFAPEEDEGMISEFISRHDDYEIVEIPKTGGIDSGRPEWSDGNKELSKTVRLWPHKLKGEGHFVAMLKKRQRFVNSAQNTDRGSNISATFEGYPGITIDYGRTRHGENSVSPGRKGRETEKYRDEPDINIFFNFLKETLNIDLEGHYNIKGSNLYFLPEQFPDLKGLKAAKFGWFLGEFLKDRFEPSHSMILALKKENIKNTLNFESGSKEVLSYLKGETLMIEGGKGITGICVDGYTLGWAKQTGDMLKNLYPKGWRKMS